MFIASFYNYTFITTNYTEATVYIKYYGQCKSKLISLSPQGCTIYRGDGVSSLTWDVPQACLHTGFHNLAHKTM